MSMNELTDQEITRALEPFATDPESFDVAVLDRIAELEQSHEEDPLNELPEWQRAVASMLPLPLLTGGKWLGAPTTASVGPAGLFGKLCSALAFPAIAVFVLLGTAAFSRRLIEGRELGLDHDDPDGELLGRTQRWYRRALPLGIPLWLAGLAIPIFTSGYAVTAFLLASTLILAAALGSLARAGILHAAVVTRVVVSGLVYVGILFGNYSFAARSELHFLPPMFTWAVLLGGSVALGLWASRRVTVPAEWPGAWRPRRPRVVAGLASIMVAMLAVVMALRLPSFALPFVSFDGALQEFVAETDFEDNSAHWRSLSQIVLSSRELEIDLDAAQPREQLSRTTDSSRPVRARPYVWTAGARCGLLQEVWNEELAREGRTTIARLANADHALRPISSLEQYEWAIRGLAAQNRLAPTEVQVLGSRLRASWPDLNATGDLAGFGALEEMWMITELLAAIGQPLDAAEKRGEVQAWLVECWTKKSRGFAPGGGFKSRPQGPAPDLRSTWFAIQLMKTYGAPPAIDYAWVRSSLQPWNYSFGDRSYLAQLLLREVDALDDVPPLTAIDWLRAEQNLILALLIVALCGYVIRTSIRASEVG